MNGPDERNVKDDLPAPAPERLPLRVPRSAPPPQPKQAVVIGQLVGIEASYPREVSVPSYLVMTMLTMGGFTRGLVLLLAAALRRGSTGGARRRWKELRKGPEYLVTPVRVRDTRGRLVELEIHGYLAANALHPKDQIRARVRRQGHPELPPRIYHLANLTTGQMIEPRPPNVWSHLGPAVLLQAGLGVLLALVVLGCVFGVLR